MLRRTRERKVPHRTPAATNTTGSPRMKPKQEGDENAELPIAVCASVSWRRRRHWHRTRYRNIRYDARFADGREELDIEIDAVLHGWRYPADAWRVHP